MTKYWGGKARLGKDIAKNMLEVIDATTAVVSLQQRQQRQQQNSFFTTYWEPFIGMGGVMRNMILPLKDRFPNMQFHASDMNEGVINFWQYLAADKRNNFDDVLDFSTDDLLYLKETKHENTPHHTLVGYSCGFHGMYFSGNITAESAKPLLNSALNSIDKVRNVMCESDFLTANFFDIANHHLPRNTIIYCDPPYVDRVKNKSKVWNHTKEDQFSTDDFWDILTYWSHPDLNNLIFVSESFTPYAEHWVPIWSKSWSNSNVKKMSSKKIERMEYLYCHRNNILDDVLLLDDIY